MKKMKLKIAYLLLISGSFVACSPTSQIGDRPGNVNQGAQRPGGNGQVPGRNGQEMPSIDELFAQMDTNKDALLSKAEVKGPLANNFAKVDTNEDGFLSKEEIEKAPKPQRR